MLSCEIPSGKEEFRAFLHMAACAASRFLGQLTGHCSPNLVLQGVHLFWHMCIQERTCSCMAQIQSRADGMDLMTHCPRPCCGKSHSTVMHFGAARITRGSMHMLETFGCSGSAGKVAEGGGLWDDQGRDWSRLEGVKGALRQIKVAMPISCSTRLGATHPLGPIPICISKRLGLDPSIPIRDHRATEYKTSYFPTFWLLPGHSRQWRQC